MFTYYILAAEKPPPATGGGTIWLGGGVGVPAHIYLYIYTYMSHQAAADSRSTLFMGAPKLLQIEAHVTPTTVQPYRG